MGNYSSSPLRPVWYSLLCSGGQPTLPLPLPVRSEGHTLYSVALTACVNRPSWFRSHREPIGHLTKNVSNSQHFFLPRVRCWASYPQGNL